MNPQPAREPEGSPAGEGLGPTPPAAARVFGELLPQAEEFARLLATSGSERGLIGPREVPRLWERHVLNCAVAAEEIGSVPRLVDVGSGAGLPGIALALALPETQVTLVEPMLRRTVWLTEVVDTLELADRVEIVRARAEQVTGEFEAPVVTARAVARLEVLAPWCLPLVELGGRMVALKGESAQQEVDETAPVLPRLGVTATRVVDCGQEVLETPTRVVVLERGAEPQSPKAGRPGRNRRSKSPRRRGKETR